MYMTHGCGRPFDMGISVLRYFRVASRRESELNKDHWLHELPAFS